MKRKTHVCLAVASITLTLPALANTVSTPNSVPDYGHLPLRFEPNVGQAPASVKYVARGAGYGIALTEGGAILEFKQALLRLSPVHGSPGTQLHAEQPQAGVSNYFIGNDRSKWHSNVPNYGAVRYEHVYPGIDWVIRGNPQKLEYDLVVAPQADPRQIRLGFNGADRLRVDDHGDLLISVGHQVLRQPKPVIYQATGREQRRNIEGRYILHGQEVTFELGAYDRTRELVIDPVMDPAFIYSTYLGGSGGNDQVKGLAVDGNGSAYVVGLTDSADFPTLDPLQSTNNETASNEATAFVAKFNAQGTALVYSTYLGGKGATTGPGDAAAGIALDSAGNVYVTGTTTSPDFPTVNPFQATRPNSGGTVFVSKLNASGSALIYSTYLGGSGINGGEATAIAIDTSGNAYVAGATGATDFPTVSAYQTTNKSGSKATAFISKLNTTGSALVYSTYLGGSGGDVATALAVDVNGYVSVAGATSSADFPTTPNALQLTYKGAALSAPNAFFTDLNQAGDTLLYSTYLGGSGRPAVGLMNGPGPSPGLGDSANAVAVDAAGNFYVAGAAASTDFPISNALQGTNRSQQYNGFVAKFTYTPMVVSSVVSSPNSGSSGGGGAVGLGFIAGLSAVLAARRRLLRGTPHH
jgi:hypothetical protein